MKIGSVFYLLYEGFRGFWKQRLMSVASIVVLTVSMVLVGGSTIACFNVDKALSTMEAKNIVMVFLQDELSDEAQKELGDKFSSMANVQSCDFVSREEAWKQQVNSLGDDASILLEGIDESPLPDAYKIALKDMNAFQQTVEEIRGVPGVLNVRENSEMASELVQIRKSVLIVAFGAFILFSLISLGVTVATLSLAISSKSLEISIMKSAGATNTFIRIPMMIQGVLYGVIAAGMSLLIMHGLYHAVATTFEGFTSSLNGTLIPFETYALPMFAVFLAYGVLEGMCGSLVSMQKYLKKGSGIYGDN